MTRQGAHLTVTEVAAALSVHPATVRRWIQSGALPAIRLPGGNYRVNADDLQQIVAQSA